MKALNLTDEGAQCFWCAKSRPAYFSALQKRAHRSMLRSMDAAPPLLVFTDLDGTLIEHESYSWAAASPALKALQEIHAGIILASSKTAAEMIVLRDELGLSDWPAIVENGAGVLEAGSTALPDPAQYHNLRAVLAKISPPLRAKFHGFGDMDVDETIRHTGLGPKEATLAKTRAFSEPGLWSGSPSERDAFLEFLAEHGITAREGGRFLTLSFGQTKADHMAEITTQFAPEFTVALGDAPNDIEMLQAANFGIIIANPNHAPLPRQSGEAEGRITRSEACGPEGWNTEMQDLLLRLNLDKGL